MNYQALSRKWRPHKFEEIVGQEQVLRALINALDTQKLHHAYLFTGIRGVGKTTLGRLFAKCVNCEQGISSKPCGVCANCVAVDKGEFLDLIEIDAASRTKVEDTRELLENVQYAPSIGRFKVYLIDEVHMLTNASFNALLKTLEEPPEYVKFVLATTDKQKLPITVLSRCLQFNLRNLNIQTIAKQLDFVLSQEKIVFENNALQMLAVAADGSMRDALSLTEQAIAYGLGQVKLENVVQMLGNIDNNLTQDLLTHIVNADIENAFALIEKISLYNANWQKLTDDLISLIHIIALFQVGIKKTLIHDNQHFIIEKATQVNADVLQFYYQLLINGKNDLSLSGANQEAFEMLILRLMNFTVNNQLEVADLKNIDHKKKLIDLENQQETQTTIKPIDDIKIKQEIDDIQEKIKVEIIESSHNLANTHKEIKQEEIKQETINNKEIKEDYQSLFINLVEDINLPFNNLHKYLELKSIISNDWFFQIHNDDIIFVNEKTQTELERFLQEKTQTNLKVNLEFVDFSLNTLAKADEAERLAKSETILTNARQTNIYKNISDTFENTEIILNLS